MVVVGDVVGVVDGADGAVARGDVAGDGGGDELVGVSLVCMPFSQVLGGSIDIPASFSRRSGSSPGTVCVTTSTVAVALVGSLHGSVVCFPLHCLRLSFIPAL